MSKNLRGTFIINFVKEEKYDNYERAMRCMYLCAVLLRGEGEVVQIDDAAPFVAAAAAACGCCRGRPCRLGRCGLRTLRLLKKGQAKKGLMQRRATISCCQCDAHITRAMNIELKIREKLCIASCGRMRRTIKKRETKSSNAYWCRMGRRGRGHGDERCHVH